MQFVQKIAFIDAFGKIFLGLTLFTGALDKIPDLKIKPAEIKFLIGRIFQKFKS